MSARHGAQFDAGSGAPEQGPQAVSLRPVPAGGSHDPAEASGNEPLAPDVRHLAAQNERLMKGVDSLLRLHESEKTQRKALQAKLDRVLEEFELSAAAARAPLALADEARRGLSEDLKPLLHAIIELLELALPHVAPAARGSPAAGPLPDVGSTEDGPGAKSVPGVDDDLPSALPEILTRSVEELVGKPRSKRPETGARETAPSAAKGPPGGNKAAAATDKGRAAPNGSRRYSWIPVTSGTPDPSSR